MHVVNLFDAKDFLMDSVDLELDRAMLFRHHSRFYTGWQSSDKKATQQDGRLQNVELAPRVGLSPSFCLRCGRQREQAGLSSATGTA
jgi:hypothetical protein